MNETFEKVEKHLYRRQYQTAGGELSTVYLARFYRLAGHTERISTASRSSNNSSAICR
jgi:hypothetical protein